VCSFRVKNRHRKLQTSDVTPSSYRVRDLANRDRPSQDRYAWNVFRPRCGRYGDQRHLAAREPRDFFSGKMSQLHHDGELRYLKPSHQFERFDTVALRIHTHASSISKTIQKDSVLGRSLTQFLSMLILVAATVCADTFEVTNSND